MDLEKRDMQNFGMQYFDILKEGAICGRTILKISVRELQAYAASGDGLPAKMPVNRSFHL